MANLELLGTMDAEAQSVGPDDLVVVAEFCDTIYPGLVSTGNLQSISSSLYLKFPN
ncbi:MAG TPA: hypothetical protein VMW15_00280 [Terracidiphilus sp.]|nr:hypothetical protein [Terracidiphilus sp.]